MPKCLLGNYLEAHDNTASNVIIMEYVVDMQPPNDRNCTVQDGFASKVEKTIPRQWVDVSDPAYKVAPARFLESPNGSWGMLQIQPRPRICRIRLDLNEPPTAVGGIYEA